MKYVPRTCVWELTLACNAHCVHCGSWAGRPRPDELDTREALGVIDELAALGCRSVTLSGGEPLLRRDWPQLAAAIRARSMRLELITNGLGVVDQAEAVADAGFFGVTFSVDGPAAIHDELRGVKGALATLLAGAERLVARGVRIGAVTQVNRRNHRRLAEVRALLIEHSFEGWQVQLTMSHGRAGERDDLCLEPSALPALERQLLALGAGGELFVQAADNIGYMSRNEPRLRTGIGEPTEFFPGCQAGLGVVGITSNGTVRGCLSLPPDADEGSIRERTLTGIWNDPEAFAYNRRFRLEDLHGPCAGCPFGKVCRGGCTSLAYAVTGRPHGNRHCLFQLSQHGQEELDGQDRQEEDGP
ncbi:MAG: radical SAM protein [bacterium]